MSGLSTLEYSCIGTQSTSTSFTHGLWAECKIPRHGRLKTQQTMWSIEQVKVSWILGASPRLPRKRSRCLPNEDSPNLAVRPQGSWKRRGSSTDGVFPRNPSKEQSSTPAWTFLQALDTRNLAGIQPCCGTRKTIPALDPGDVWQKIEMYQNSIIPAIWKAVADSMLHTSQFLFATGLSNAICYWNITANLPRARTSVHGVSAWHPDSPSLEDCSWMATWQ